MLLATLAVQLVACGNGTPGDPSTSASPIGARSATSDTKSGTGSPTAASIPPTSKPPLTATAAPVSRVPDADGRLRAAARAGDLVAVRTALAEGGDPNAGDSDGVTPLIAAAYGNHVEVAEALISAGGDVNRKDRTIQSAYLIATSEIGDSGRALAFLRLMLASGADVNGLDSFNGTGLIRAADRGYLEIVRELLKTKINVDHVNRLGWTALLEAVILGGGDARHTEVVRVLVAAGVDVNIADRDGVTPLGHASRRSYAGMVGILEAAGAK